MCFLLMAHWDTGEGEQVQQRQQQQRRAARATHELVPLHLHRALGRALVEDELAQRRDDEAAAEHPLHRRKTRVVPAVDLAVVDELRSGARGRACKSPAVNYSSAQQLTQASLRLDRRV